MTDITAEHLDKLMRTGAHVEQYGNFRTLKIGGLSLDSSVRLGYALTVELGKPVGNESGSYSSATFPLEAVLTAAQQKLEAGERTVFGETRPADRNVAVRVEAEGLDFLLTADVRNDFEDFPELAGNERIKAGLLAVLEIFEP